MEESRFTIDSRSNINHSFVTFICDGDDEERTKKHLENLKNSSHSQFSIDGHLLITKFATYRLWRFNSNESLSIGEFLKK